MLNKQYSNSGSSLVEVMIALFLLAIGLLGVLSMQTQAVKRNQNAYLYSQASMLAADMYERVRSNQRSRLAYGISYDEDPESVPACAGDPTQLCSSGDLVSWDTNLWKNSISQILPQGGGDIAYNGDAIIIRVRFAIDFEEDEAGNARATFDEVVLQSRI
jgi:type IV pilus assembly protein PilV